jgi:hypothetical protein
MFKMAWASIRVIWHHPELLFYHFILTATGLTAFLLGLVVFVSLTAMHLSPWVVFPVWFLFMGAVLGLATGLATLNVTVSALILRFAREGIRATPDRVVHFLRERSSILLRIACSAYLSVRIPVRVRADMLCCALVLTEGRDWETLTKTVERDFGRSEMRVMIRRGRAGMIVSLLWLPVFLLAALVLPSTSLSQEWRRTLLIGSGLSLIPITWLFRMFFGLAVPVEVVKE